FQNQIVYLGHVIDKRGIRPDTTRLKPLKQILPKTKKQLQRLVGIINWYRPYIKDLSQKMIKIYDKLKRNNKFEWTDSDTEDIKLIYAEIEKQTLLYYPDINLPFQLKTDASDTCIGATLKQKEKIIGFYSYKLNKSEKNYTIVEKETLDIIKSLLHFKNIIFNSPIEVRTDNANLLYNGPLSKRIERWKYVLQEFNITFKHIKGKNNTIADSFSRFNISQIMKLNLSFQLR
ncbi:Transposon Tf2-11 polyprotein, partial [Dictyocoela muelleri]